MNSERTPILLPGLMQDGTGGPATKGQAPRVSYDRVVTRCDLFTEGDPPVVACQFQLTLDSGTGAVTQAGVYAIPALTTRGENAVATPPSGLLVPANSFPGIICVQAGGGMDVVAWLTSVVQSAITSGDPWVTPTYSDLRTTISDPEYEAFTDSILQGVSDPTGEIIDDVVNEFRGAVARGGYQMGLEGSIPQELLRKALTVMKFELLTRVDTLKPFAASLKETVEKIRMFLDDKVAEGKTAVSVPVVLMVGKMQSASQAQTVTRSRKRFTRCRQDGLT